MQSFFLFSVLVFRSTGSCRRRCSRRRIFAALPCVPSSERGVARTPAAALPTSPSLDTRQPAKRYFSILVIEFAPRCKNWALFFYLVNLQKTAIFKSARALISD